MEEELAKRMNEVRSKGGCIGRKYIELTALAIASEMKLPFKFSNGWIHRFLERFNFSLRRVTTVGREKPQQTVQTIKKFLNDVNHKYRNFADERIFNMDECSIRLDCPTSYTYTQKGNLYISLFAQVPIQNGLFIL